MCGPRAPGQLDRLLGGVKPSEQVAQGPPLTEREPDPPSVLGTVVQQVAALAQRPRLRCRGPQRHGSWSRCAAASTTRVVPSPSRSGRAGAETRRPSPSRQSRRSSSHQRPSARRSTVRPRGRRQCSQRPLARRKRTQRLTWGQSIGVEVLQLGPDRHRRFPAVAFEAGRERTPRAGARQRAGRGGAAGRSLTGVDQPGSAGSTQPDGPGPAFPRPLGRFCPVLVLSTMTRACRGAMTKRRYPFRPPGDWACGRWPAAVTVFSAATRAAAPRPASPSAPDHLLHAASSALRAASLTARPRRPSGLLPPDFGRGDGPGCFPLDLRPGQLFTQLSHLRRQLSHGVAAG